MILSILFLLVCLSVDSSLQYDDFGYNKVCTHDYQVRLAAAINRNRAIHQTPPLVLDETNYELIRYATEQAAFNAGLRPYPPPRPAMGFGEFDATFTYSWISPESLIDNFYHAGDDYPYYGREPPMEAIAKYGVFTQMIWVASQRISFGCADSGGNRFLVATFVPPGNFIGQFAYNVRPPYNNSHRRPFGEQQAVNATVAPAAADSETD